MRQDLLAIWVMLQDLEDECARRFEEPIAFGERGVADFPSFFQS